MAENWRAEVNTEVLYTDAEHAHARRLYALDHPAGPAWEQADRRVRGRYLERGGRASLAEFAAGR